MIRLVKRGARPPGTGWKPSHGSWWVVEIQDLNKVQAREYFPFGRWEEYKTATQARVDAEARANDLFDQGHDAVIVYKQCQSNSYKPVLGLRKAR